ncbi:hypothetical protein PN36_18020 [Candidatus Thiomargarita nelsonii]|uniref:Toxin CptA n=1 Tax=Candidatus Thiomargarita nelsonii TaxID=1003181 RepID=A0A0A6PD20_9GAMM|nr:hypothetical protein PN36_18020 [Candidatus Thiomargarita nelsonii]
MSTFSSPLCLEPRFSKRFALSLILVHCGALLLLLPITLPIDFALLIKLSIGLLVLASALHTTRRHLLLIDHPLYGCILHYDEDSGCLRVVLQSGFETKMASGSYSHPQLVILRVHGKKNEALIIFPDALDIETFRHLRVHLRHAV